MQKIEVNRASELLPHALTDILPSKINNAIRCAHIPYAEELRLHANREATLTVSGRNVALGVSLTVDEMQALLRDLCAGSLYAHGESIRQGFLSLRDGVRVGISGTAAIESGRMIGVREISGLIVRIPHRLEVDATPILSELARNSGIRGMLIYAPPGVGKTTLLRAIAASASSPAHGIRTVCVDSRAELRYGLEDTHLTLDILVGYPRALGIEIAVRSLGAQLIICDEIGSEEDAEAILSAANCGVPLVATAHARTQEELLDRPAIAKLHRARVFDAYVALSRVGNRFSYTIRHQRADGGVR